MRQLLILVLLSTISIKGKAQGFPLYVCDTINNPNIDTLLSTGWRPFDIDENITQTIYHKADFPTMPVQGFISDIFIRIAYPTPAGAKLYGLTVKIGTTTMKNYPMSWSTPQFLNVESSLTTVFYDSMYVLGTALPASSWWKLSLPQPYQYSFAPLPGDVAQNLVVQLSQDSTNTVGQTWRFNLREIKYQGNGLRCARANKSPNGQTTWVGSYNGVQILGFNGYALSVDDPQKKIPFSVFPNPATDKLQLGKEVGGAYEVYNMAGVKVAAGRVAEGAQVDVQHLPPGMYLLKMGERTAKFVKR